MNEDFWNQFWPQFWGGVASTLFLGVLTIVFTYAARLRLALFFRGVMENMKRRIEIEEAKIKERVEESRRSKGKK